jgi:uncharacterized protein YecT (DUF1311 family)
MIFAFLAVAAAPADERPDCFNDPTATQAQLNDCAYQQYREADRALNVQWHKTTEAARRLDKNLASSEKPAFDHLLRGQRAWLTYRDETCVWVRAGDGSIAPMNFYNCMAGMTNARTEELKSLALAPNSGEPL